MRRLPWDRRGESEGGEANHNINVGHHDTLFEMVFLADSADGNVRFEVCHLDLGVEGTEWDSTHFVLFVDY